MAGSRLYISYNWTEESQNGLVDLLESQCSNYSFQLRRDRNLVEPGDHFFSLAAEIANGAKTVVLLSDNYLLNSKWCVLELNELVKQSSHNYRWWVVNSTGFSLSDFLGNNRKCVRFKNRCTEINSQYEGGQLDERGRSIPIIDGSAIVDQLNRISDTMQDPLLTQVNAVDDWQQFLLSLRDLGIQQDVYHSFDDLHQKKGLTELLVILETIYEEHLEGNLCGIFETRLKEFDDSYDPEDRGINTTTICGRICRTHPETFLNILQEVYLPTLHQYVSPDTPAEELNQLRLFTYSLFFGAVKTEWINESAAAFRGRRLEEIDFDVDDPAAIRFLIAACAGDSVVLSLEDIDGLPTLVDPNIPDTSAVLEDKNTDRATETLLIAICKAIGVTENINAHWKPVDWAEYPDGEKFWRDTINTRLHTRRKLPDAVVLPVQKDMDQSVISRARNTLSALQLVTLKTGNGEQSLIMRQSTVMTCMAECIAIIESASLNT